MPLISTTTFARVYTIRLNRDRLERVYIFPRELQKRGDCDVHTHVSPPRDSKLQITDLVPVLCFQTPVIP